MISHGKNIKILAGNSHPALAMQIASALGLPLAKCTVGHFADGRGFCFHLGDGSRFGCIPHPVYLQPGQ